LFCKAKRISQRMVMGVCVRLNIELCEERNELTRIRLRDVSFFASFEFRVGSMFGSRAGAARRSEPLMRRLKSLCWSMADPAE